VCCVYSLVTGVGKWLPKWDFTSLQHPSDGMVVGTDQKPLTVDVQP
jgi:hypothetical protein